MCGIAGIAMKHGGLPDERMLERMSLAIAHRGPDGSGVWSMPGVGLAHRRLSIIDLSPRASQPMHDAKNDLTVVFNGEIYNYKELRASLPSVDWKSDSDTEVILEGYRAWGDDVVTKLRGMFAFALWDAPRRRLLVSRDRTGKKPFFYTFTDGGDFAFASEIKALKEARPLRPDWDAVRLFLGLQYVPSPRTGFEGVFQLEPGTRGVFDASGWRVGHYHRWERSRFGMLAMSPQETDAKILQLIDDATKVRQLAADVPVGAFLSGGIDSAAIVAHAIRHTPSLKTFTMGFPSAKMDERQEARALANHFHTDHHEFEARPEDLTALVDAIVHHYDAPYADSSALPLWLLAQETSKHIKVVLTGDGGDEAFGGYRRYAAFERALQVSHSPGGSLLASLLGNFRTDDPRYRRMADVVAALKRRPETAYGEMFCGSYFGTPGLTKLCTPEFLATTEKCDAVQFIAGKTSGEARVEAAMVFDLTSYLPDDLNVKMDRATMRFGLEARAPFLDQEFVDFALRLPLKEKVHRGNTKVALKRALRGVIPDDVLSRPKRGFQVPLAEWFRGPLAGLVRERCLDPNSPLLQIMRADAIEKLVKENAQGADHGNRLWMLLALSTWLNIYES